MADETRLTAASRIEKLLDNIAGGDNEVTPATRLEKFLSYIADAMEGTGGCEDCVKVLDGEYFNTQDHTDARIYAYTVGDGWVELTGIGSIFITDADIPAAYAIKDITTQFPGVIIPVDFVSGETHTPEVSAQPGYYVEYADGYSECYLSQVEGILILKNGDVNYHQGLS